MSYAQVKNMFGAFINFISVSTMVSINKLGGMSFQELTEQVLIENSTASGILFSIFFFNSVRLTKRVRQTMS